MMVKVRFFAYFRDVFGGREMQLSLTGPGTVTEALTVLCDTPERRREIFAGNGLQPHLVVMVNGVPIGSLQGPETPLAPGDAIAVFPIMGGG